MARDTEVDTLIINELKKEQYTSAEISDTELYYVTDEKIAIEDIDNLQEELDAKQAKLVAGPNITINPDTNEISATGGGEPIDAYTKAETDGLLEEKQDVLTPNDPLKIETYVKTNLNNMVYTADGNGIYRGTESPISAGLGAKYYFGMDSSSGIFVSIDPNKALVNYTPEEIMFANGYVQMPYTFGQIVRGGNPATSSYNSSIMVFGKLVGNDFIPILARNYGSERSTPELELFTSDNITIEETGSRPSSTGRNYRLKQTGTSLPSGGYATTLYGVPTTVKITDNAGIINISYIHNDYYTSQNISNTAYVERLREIDTVRLFPIYNRGSSEATAIQVSKIGLYTTNASLTKDTPVVPPAEWGPNQFDLSGVTAYNYLDLKTDSSLTVTSDGNLSVNTDAMAFGSELDYDGTNLSLLSSDGSTLSSVEISGGSSDAYSKAETDELLADKQGVFEAKQPLNMQITVENNMHECTAASDGTITPNDGQYMMVNATSARHDSQDFQNASDPNSVSGYIDIPFVNNQLIKVPMPCYYYKSGSSAYRYAKACAFYGKKLSNGDFIPIYPITGYGITSYSYTGDTYYQSQDIMMSDTSTYTSGYGWSYSSARDVSPDSFIRNDSSITGFPEVPNCTIYSQLNVQAGRVDLWTVGTMVSNTSGSDKYVSKYKIGVTTISSVDRFKEINAIRVYPTTNITAFKTEMFGAYDADITTITDLAQLGPNKLDLNASQTFRALQLKTDNTTIKVNDEGNLEALYPAELNGVKLFPITQAAYDGLPVKDPYTLYIIIQENV